MKKTLIESTNRLQSIEWYDGLDESIFFFYSSFSLQRKLHLISLLFVYYSVIKLRYFSQNYLLNNFCLLIGLLRLVCLLIVGQKVHSYLIIKSLTRRIQLGIYIHSLMTNILQQQLLYCFIWSSNQLLFRLFYLSTQFLSVFTIESPASID